MQAACCGWDAFDFSESWISRWCEFRDDDAVRAVGNEIARLRSDLNSLEPDTKIGIDCFFNPTVAALRERLSQIDNVLDSHIQ